MVTVIDAENLLLGRMASVVARRLLEGEEIAIVNAERAIVSGDRAMVLSRYDQKRKRGSREGGPHFPRRPDHIVKRTVRGMVPYKTARGREAFRRLRVYVGVPAELSGMSRERIEEADISRLNNPKYISVGAISTHLGAKF
ncbi:MAG: 50S ribosomal protein L13 [Methanoculleaceae archaeon]